MNGKPTMVVFSHPTDSVRGSAVSGMRAFEKYGFCVTEMSVMDLELVPVTSPRESLAWRFRNGRTGVWLDADAMAMWEISQPTRVRAVITELFEHAGAECFQTALGTYIGNDAIRSYQKLSAAGLRVPRYAEISPRHYWVLTADGVKAMSQPFEDQYAAQQTLGTLLVQQEATTYELRFPDRSPLGAVPHEQRRMALWRQWPTGTLRYNSPDIPYPLVLKGSPGGRDGELVRKVASPAALRTTYHELRLLAETVSVEEFIDTGAVDYRVTVSNGKVVGVGRRTARRGEFRTNWAVNGGYNVDPVPFEECHPTFLKVARRVAEVTHLPDLCGVDMTGALPGLEPADPHAYLIFEPNVLAGFLGVTRSTRTGRTEGVNVAGHVARGMMRGLKARMRRGDRTLAAERDYIVTQTEIPFGLGRELGNHGLLPAAVAARGRDFMRSYDQFGVPKTDRRPRSARVLGSGGIGGV